MNVNDSQIKAIFDTNVRIGFLIGKRLSGLERHISSRKVAIVVTARLLEEIKEVAGRPHLLKYFDPSKVMELIRLLETIALQFETTQCHFNCRDPKDNFLLDLITASKADYLITGDKDLLTLNPFETATILSPGDFENLMTKL